MATTRHILRILCLSVLLNLIHFSMSLENNSLHQSHQQVLCPNNVGFFHPDVPDVHGPGPVVAVGSDMIYRDIYIWVDMLSELVNISSTENITQVIQPCLRGSAAIWWLVELTSEEREKLREASLERWSSILIKRFGLPESVASEKFESSRYTPKSVALKRFDSSWYTPQDLAQPPRVWIHQMIQYSKAADIYDLDFDLLLLAIWVHFDLNLRVDIPIPRTNTTLIEFLEKVDDAYPLWIAKSRGYFGGFRPSNSRVPSSNSGFINVVANAVLRLI